MNSKFDVVNLDGKNYYVAKGKKPRYIGRNAVLNRITGSTYSDHSLMFSTQSLRKISVGTFNACLTNLALRGLQGLCNSSGQYEGMITGDGFDSDFERRRHVINYILDELRKCDVLLLQEIDRAACEIIESYGVSVMYTEDYHNSVRGGNAICSMSSHILLHDPEPIWDEWNNKLTGEINRKHVGTYCVATVGKKSYSVASYHFDKYTQIDIVKPFMRTKYCIFGGDFNKDVNNFNKLSTDELLVERMTEDDISRKVTIDAIFFSKLVSAKNG